MKKAHLRTGPSAGFRVVALGGGTGLSALLRGLKEHVVRRSDRQATAERPIRDLAAIVTVTDDGGSSGRLRRENRMLPPGDIRNCMVALSKDETLLSRLFQYRFHAGRGLRGHNFGNLFLAALTHVTGDFAEAVRVSSKVLAVRDHGINHAAANVLANGPEMVAQGVICGLSGLRHEIGDVNPRRCRAGDGVRNLRDKKVGDNTGVQRTWSHENQMGLFNRFDHTRKRTHAARIQVQPANRNLAAGDSRFALHLLAVG